MDEMGRLPRLAGHEMTAKKIRGLFPAKPTIEDFDLQTQEALRSAFSGINPTAKPSIDIAIHVMRIEANAYQSTSPDNQELGALVLQHIERMNFFRHSGEVDQALHHLFLATQFWTQLRVNVKFEKPVRSRARSTEQYNQNRASQNERRAKEARDRVTSAFQAWRNKLHPTVLSTDGVLWPIKKQVRAYHRAKSVTARQKRLLNKLADNGELK